MYSNHQGSQKDLSFPDHFISDFLSLSVVHAAKQKLVHTFYFFSEQTELKRTQSQQRALNWLFLGCGQDLSGLYQHWILIHGGKWLRHCRQWWCVTYCPAAPRAVEEGCWSIHGSVPPELTAGSLGSTGGTWRPTPQHGPHSPTLNTQLHIVRHQSDIEKTREQYIWRYIHWKQAVKASK